MSLFQVEWGEIWHQYSLHVNLSVMYVYLIRYSYLFLLLQSHFLKIYNHLLKITHIIMYRCIYDYFKILSIKVVWFSGKHIKIKYTSIWQTFRVNTFLQLELIQCLPWKFDKYNLSLKLQHCSSCPCH